MTDNIISYLEMCRREGLSLQAGMNFGVGGNHSVILMSVRPNAPYRDRIEDDGTTLIYEGHNQPRREGLTNPKRIDQLDTQPNGSLTQNGKFQRAAKDAKAGRRRPERVRVYEKIKPGIWSYNGIFHLVDSWTERDEHRVVFKFRLEAVEGEEDLTLPAPERPAPRRIIPTAVKLEVWKRDGGKCVVCGAINDLHFDHDLPFSLGGTSISAANVQLLCARHNLEKHDSIR
ncbi:MAG TPA: HNH endonuclease [Vicinamibacterales bacterium]|nr:HNH endonuclease [Vicinamibacterales bacterium]